MERSKERVWLSDELHGLLKNLLPGEQGTTLDTCYQWFTRPDAQEWKNGWINPGGWGRFFTYSVKRRKTMIREELKRLIDTGKVIKVTPRKRKEWWKQGSKAPRPVTLYKAVGLLDALAHAAKRPAQLARLA